MLGRRRDTTLVTAAQRHALGRKADRQTNCITSGVYQNEVDHVQNHTKMPFIASLLQNSYS
jgi:hypothetical protein